VHSPCCAVWAASSRSMVAISSARLAPWRRASAASAAARSARARAAARWASPWAVSTCQRTRCSRAASCCASSSTSRARSAPRRLRLPQLLRERLELGAPLERAARGGAGEEHRAVRAAQRPPTVEHFVASEQGAHPRCSRPVHAQLVGEGVPVGRAAGTGCAGQQHERTGPGPLVPLAHRLHGGVVAYPHRHLGGGGPLRLRAGGALAGCLGELLAQLPPLSLERGALAVERPGRLGATLQILLELAHRRALRLQPVTAFLLERAAAFQLA